MSSIRYQPHIDGLRAVAVLLVIFHHLGDWAGLSGGFVGVDVFFVISGFLITTIVRVEVEQGRFTLGNFYKRRVIRLAPAYYLVLSVTTAAALIWMLPAELMAYARSMVASSVFLANFHMWKEVGGYFGASADTVPLLHLWSLAVEEQFYIFWPVAILVVHRMIPSRWIVYGILCVVVIGAIVSQWGVLRYPAAAYYLLPTRFFQLAVGALLVYLPAVGGAGSPWRSSSSIVGIIMILFGALSYGKETLFPGFSALVPVVGTAMVLRYGQQCIVGKVLSHSCMTSIGRVSYPAYLWHWPIIVFLTLNEVRITAFVGVWVVAATFLLSWLTYRYIELPARRLQGAGVRQVVLGAGLTPMAVAVALGFSLAALHGLPGRFPESLNKRSEALLALSSKARGRCNEGPPAAPLPPDQCVLGRTDGRINFLLVGDSHANHFSGFMDVLGKNAGLRGYDMTRSNTPFLPGVERWMMRDGDADYHRNFSTRNAYVASLLKRERFDVIVLAGNYTGFYENEVLRADSLKGHQAFEVGMREAIKAAQSAAPKVIVITTIPKLSKGLHDCTLRSERFGLPLSCELPLRDHLERTKRVSQFLHGLQRDFPDLVLVTPDAIMCDASYCLTEMDGVPLYEDDGHLNDVGSRLLARVWLERFGNPLAPTRSVDSRTSATAR